MFLAEHAAGQGWGAPAIKPLGMLQLHPASQVLGNGGADAAAGPGARCIGAASRMQYSTASLFSAPGQHTAPAWPLTRPCCPAPAPQVLHYGMCCFEGMKAYQGADGRVRLFRPERNMARLRRSARRLQLADFDPQARGAAGGWAPASTAPPEGGGRSPTAGSSAGSDRAPLLN